MKIRFLGTAAGGGCPQWNCACAECVRARHEGADRTQDCLAISGDGVAWYLVNASPDLRTQLLRTAELAPGPGTRETPVRGVLLTSAEVDHSLGILTLREAKQMAIYGTRTVLDALPWLPILDHYLTVDRRVVSCGEPTHLEGGLTVTAFALGAKRPRYASAHASAGDWVTGLRFTDSCGGSLTYAPCLYTLDDALTVLTEAADVVVLDGTFLTAHEPVDCGAGGSGHLPIQESLPLLQAYPGPRYLYTHLNNTNPVATRDSPHQIELAKSGAQPAPEAGLIEL